MKTLQRLRRQAALVLTGFMFSLAVTIGAQTPSGGAIAGQVLGPGNVPAPGARVMLIDLGTRQRKLTWTDGAGNYRFPNLAPGTYSVVATLIGFRPAFVRPFSLSGSGIEKMNLTLQFAMPGEQPMMMGRFGGGMRGRRGAARGGQVPNRQLGAPGGVPSGVESGLPPAILNQLEGEETGGAGSANLRFSQKAGEGGTGQNGVSSSSVNMSASASNSFVLTGNVMNVPAPMGPGGPGMFMINGRMMRAGAGPAMVFGGGPVTVRVGGPGPMGAGGPGPMGGPGIGGPVIFFAGRRRARVNQLHGILFDSYTNSAFDANPYPLNVPFSPQIPSYSSRAGISLGGPLSIPHIYNGANKTSFFVHYMMVRDKSPFDSFATVPTPAERNGDFASTLIPSGALAGTTPVIYNPLSAPLGSARTPFPGNQIPSSMFNPASSALLSYIPLPNLPGQVQNFHLQESLPTATDVVMGRVGQQFSAKDNLSAFYFFMSSRTNSVNNFPLLTSHTSTRNQNLNVTESHTFSAHTVNNLSANFNRMRNFLLNPFAFNQNIVSELGIQGVSQNPMDWGVPLINFTNFSGLNDTIPSLTRNQTLSFSDFLVLTRGNHNLQLGGDVRFVQLNSLTDPDARGTFAFSGYTTSDFSAPGTPVNGTGFDFADFLLGFPQTTSARFGSADNYLRSRVYDAFAMDDWRFNNHFTFDFGLRYDYFSPFAEKYGHLSDLAFGPGFTNGTVVTGESPDGLPSSLLYAQPRNVSPRIGIAYRPWTKHSLVVRAGYSIFYDGSIYQDIAPNLINEPPFASTSTLITSAALPLTLQDGFPTAGKNVTTNNYAVDPHFLTPYAQSWDLMLEQQLVDDLVLNFAYIGTRGNHLNLLIAPNVATSTQGQGGLLLGNAQPFIYDTSGAASDFQGLRVSLRRMFHGGLMLFANYTYSKAMDDAASVGGAGNTVAQNPFDLAAEWGLSTFNHYQNFLLGYHYQLPFGDRKRFLSHGGRLAKIFGGWEVSGFTRAESGSPFTALVQGNLSNNVNGSAPFNSLRADVTGQPVNLLSGLQTPLEWFNTAAFTVPPAGEYGNAGRDTIPGPATIDVNASIDRLFTISREKGVNGDLRLAANNLFNTPQFTGLATTVNATNFGRITSVGMMRTLSVTLRLRF